MKRILLFILFVPSVLVALQGSFHFFKERELSGYVKEPVLKVFSLGNIFDGNFQQSFEAYLQRFCGFQPTLIRLNNQIRYSLFHQISTSEVVPGKNDVLFNKPGLVARQGTYAMDQSVAIRMADSLSFIQQELEKRGIKLVVVIAPNKAWFYESSIPEKYKAIEKTSNESILSKALKERRINLINFHSYLLGKHKQKGASLMSKRGIHWSYYGAFVATDSLCNYLNNSGVQPKFTYTWKDSFSKEIPPNTDDYDIEQSLNLLVNISGESLCYPKLTFSEQKAVFSSSLLVISDSFYNQMAKNKILANGFSNIDFYYYNKIHTSGNSKVEETMTDKRFQQYLKNKKAIILMATESNLKELGWGSIATMHRVLQLNPLTDHKN